MKPLQNLSDVNTNSKEGRYLMAALAILTTQPKLKLFGEDKSGEQMTPNEMLEHIYKLQKTMYEDTTDIPDTVEEKLTFDEALEQLINKYSQENGSNTPDFILSKFLYECLEAFNHAVKQREQWYGVPHSILFQDEINAFLKEQFYEAWMDDNDWLMFLEALETQSGVSVQSLSNDLQVGLKNGHSIEKQFELIRIALKNGK